MPQMTTSRSGLIFIACREAIVEVAYPDGRWLTVGIGHNGPDVLPTAHWTPQQALAQLRADVHDRYERDVNRMVKVPLSQHKFDALVSFHFNRGNRDFAYPVVSTETVIDAVNSGDQGEVARLFPLCNTNLAGEHKDGLTIRRRAELAMYADGVYGPLGLIPWYKADPHTSHRFEYVVLPDDLT